MKKAKRFLAILCTLAMMLSVLFGTASVAFANGEVEGEIPVQDAGEGGEGQVPSDPPAENPEEGNSPQDVPAVEDVPPVVEENQPEPPAEEPPAAEPPAQEPPAEQPPVADNPPAPAQETPKEPAEDPKPAAPAEDPKPAPQEPKEDSKEQSGSQQQEQPAQNENQDGNGSGGNNPSSADSASDGKEATSDPEQIAPNSADPDASSQQSSAGVAGEDESDDEDGDGSKDDDQAGGKDPSASTDDEEQVEGDPNAVPSEDPEGKDTAVPEKTGDEDGEEEEAEDEEPEALVLKIGGEVSGTIGADEPFVVNLEAGNNESVKLALDISPTVQFKATYNGDELVFQSETDQGASASLFAAVVEVQNRSSQEIILTAASETDFSMKALLVRNETDPEEKEEKEEDKEDEKEEEKEDEKEEEKGDIDTGEISPEDKETGADNNEPIPDVKDESAEEEPVPAEQSVSFDIYYDGEPVYGGLAHFRAILVGYEGLEYELTWQKSVDDETWEDTDVHSPEMDVEINDENCELFWRLKVVIPDDQLDGQRDEAEHTEVE